MRSKNFLLLLLLAGALAACGAERDEPFDPDTGGTDDDDPDRERITVDQVLRADTTLLDIDGDRQNLIFRDEDTYFLFLDRYTDTLPANDPDFASGQVVLIDLGEREDSDCDYRLELKSVYAEEYNDNAARMVLNLREREATAAKEDCPAEDAESLRPFYFYYVASRRPLIIAETIDD